jgi:hypothetical protein
MAEFALAPAEARRLLGAETIDRELLAFLYPAYLAFQLGRHALAIDVAGPADAARLRAATDRYAGLLRIALAPPAAP